MNKTGFPHISVFAVISFLLVGAGTSIRAQTVDPFPVNGTLYFEDRTSWPVSELVHILPNPDDWTKRQNHDWDQEEFSVYRPIACAIQTQRNTSEEGHVFLLRCRLIRKAAIIAKGTYSRQILQAIRDKTANSSHLAKDVEEDSKRNTPRVFANAHQRCYRYDPRRRELSSYSDCKPHSLSYARIDTLSPVTEKMCGLQSE